MKFLFTLFLSMISINQQSIKNYQAILEEATSENELLVNIKNYSLILGDDCYILADNQGVWQREINISNNYKLIIDNDNCLIFYYENELLSLLEYDSNGNKIYDDIIIDNPIYEKWDVLYDGFIYIVGGVSKYQNIDFIAAKNNKSLKGKDAFIAKLNKNYLLLNVGVFGGNNDEQFLKVTKSEDKLYVAGEKNPGGGGDFGNGGRSNNTVFIADLNKDLVINNYRILSTTNNLVSLKYYKERIYLVLEKRIYKFDEDLSTLYREDFKVRIFESYFSDINRFIIFTSNTAYIYKIYPVILEEKLTYPETTNIQAFDKFIYLQASFCDYYLDIACLENFKPATFYCPYIENELTINTLFGPAVLIDKESEPYFNPSVYGFYLWYYNYRTCGDLNFTIEYETYVRLEANVNEGNIYPVGYRLLFTGQALLNQKNILNNYRIDQPGQYRLELQGTKGEVEVINFMVSYDQMNFLELSEKAWDIEVGVGEVFFIELEYNSDDNYDVLSVVINNEEITDLLLDTNNKIISIRMTALDKAGIYYYYLEKINYFYNDDYYTYNIDNIITLNVLMNPPNVSIMQINEWQYRVSLFDSDKTTRYFLLTISSNLDEVDKQYSLSDTKLLITGLSAKNEYHIELSVVYNLGNNFYQNIKLLEFNIIGCEEYQIGEIEIIEKGDTLNEFDIHLNKSNSISKVFIDHKPVNLTNQKTSLKTLFLVGGTIILSISLVCFSRIIILRKKQ